MSEESFPAIALMKQESPQTETPLCSLVAQLLADKGMKQPVLRLLAHQSPLFLGTLFGHLLMRSSTLVRTQGVVLQRGLRHLSLPHPNYQGTRRENAQIDASWEQAAEPGNGLRSKTWRGASGVYERSGLTIPSQMKRVPITVIGAGVAGLLATRALLDVGFTHLLLLDQQEEYGGIWSRNFLRGGSRANPFPLTFEGNCLEAAPGPGDAVMHWLRAIAEQGTSPLPRVVKARVQRVVPGDLSHRVQYEDEHGQQREVVSPLVVNAVGVGEPLLPLRPGVMTTDVLPEHAGKRWQEIWTHQHARRYHHRSLVFISLSNSTLEMVKQVQRWKREAGIDIDYRIITHYPDAALAEPTKEVWHQGRKMRLYRDPEQMRLLRLAGDLPEVGAAFEEARETGRILSHVTHWSLEGEEAQRQVVAVREGGEVQRIPVDELFTLIGYGPRAEMLEQMGMSVNHRYLGAIDLDYDSEVQREPGSVGRERVWPGYFALGLRNAFNGNEVLLPGILFRLPDLVAGVILRAAEWVARSPDPRAFLRWGTDQTMLERVRGSTKMRKTL